MQTSYLVSALRTLAAPCRRSSRQVQVLQSGLRTVQNLNGASIRLYYLQCLAQASYMIQHENTAFLVDPRRDVEVYLEDLEAEELSLKGILLTHIHADFVSGHKELIDRTGATVYMGPGTRDRCQFPLTELQDNESIDMSGKFSVRALHTPGHTPESMTFLLVNKMDQEKPLAAFTGDTLFIGSVGRPDLVGSLNFTAEYMSEMLYNSLEKKIKVLPEDVVVYPAHGAGSPCGKNLSDELWSTIGKEKLNNPALQFDAVLPFVKYLTEDQPLAPQYFSHDVSLNLAGAPTVSEAVDQCRWIKPSELYTILQSDKALCIIDTRSTEEQCRSRIPGSLSFAMGSDGGATLMAWEGNFAIWVGTLVSPNTRLVVVTSKGQETEAIQRLARVGYKAEIVLDGGVEAWEEEQLPTEKTDRMKVKSEEQLTCLTQEDDNIIIDVRTVSEYATNHVTTAMNIPLSDLMQARHDLDKSKQYLLYCRSGYRSFIGVSVLKSIGLQATDFVGGFAALNVHAPQSTVTGEVCPNLRKTLEDFEAAERATA